MFVCYAEKTKGPRRDIKNVDGIEDGVDVDSSDRNILIFHHMGSLSHLHFIRPLAKGLADVGHNVTLVQYSPSGYKHDHITEIIVANR